MDALFHGNAFELSKKDQAACLEEARGLCETVQTGSLKLALEVREAYECRHP